VNDVTDIEKTVRQEWGRLLSSLIAYLGDFELAEDSLQDALESALQHWKRNGLPRSPYAWLLQTARRKAIDRIRRNVNFRKKQSEYQLLLELEAEEDADDFSEETIPDERLRLIFTCCHPALEEKTRVALTLRTLGGLTTREIAKAFLDTEEAMAQRLVRAKRKIRKAGIPYRIPNEQEWPDRLASVLNVLYLIFNEGYSASSGGLSIRVDLCEEALRLTRIMVHLTSDEADVKGLLALLILNHSRREARYADDGSYIPLDRQDRKCWKGNEIREGVSLVESALASGRPGAYQIQAAISAVHSEATSHAETDWQEITLLYDRLYEIQPNPVIRLNYCVALSYTQSEEKALNILLSLEKVLKGYQPYYAAKADLLRRTGDPDGAMQAYQKAIEYSENPFEKEFLHQQSLKRFE